MNWKIAVIVSILLALFFFVSNITGGVSDGYAPTVSNLVYNLSDNTVSFDLSAPASSVSNHGYACASQYPFTHWICPSIAKLRLSITP